MADLQDLEMTDFNVQAVLQKAAREIDWDKVDSKIQDAAAFSKEWLKKTINELKR